MFEQAYTELELIDRHMLVLKFVVERGPIGILKLSDETGMQAHKVRYSLRILEQNGLIKPSQQGAVAGDSVASFLQAVEERYGSIRKLVDDIENTEKSIKN
ncbi:hypothetical protein MsAg5_06260 [Methanosarcinaceae archaeon Ag5]|uniref:Uncharacterized protein n=1 Tax=Methanolapillus africanus TaxID=3028297 RepID=A0AAE4SCS9_9EURY|nr:hypothetical protein [Methanosarcinaceae archaeon Ag5]